MNISKAKEILSWLASQGVQTLCLCPGGRNAPLVALLEKTRGFEVFSFYDERSAGFFAIGKIKKQKRPVAVITTSGTAVSELLSPIIEAHYSDMPLIAITADRPKRMRGTGAPQVIEQKNIFSDYVETCVDLDVTEGLSVPWTQLKPLHMNICFDEPLVDEEISDFTVEPELFPKTNSNSLEFPENFKRPLVVLSGLSQSESLSVEKALESWKGPIFAESLSGLKDSEVLSDKLIQSGDHFVCGLLDEEYFDSVIRVGDVPVGRFWRNLDKSERPVFSISSKTFSGCEKGMLKVQSLNGIENQLPSRPWDWSAIKKQDKEFRKQIDSLFEKLPQAEASLVNHLSQQLNMPVYLGNSMPIRLWDLCSQRKNSVVWANRGANGIDGQLSTATGLLEPGERLSVILGDLTTLYDFSAFWISSRLKEMNVCLNLFVINNQGGKIFSRIFKSPLFLNSHELNFEHLAKAWGWQYEKNSQLSESSYDKPGLRLIEVCPDPEQTETFWKSYDQIWKN